MIATAEINSVAENQLPAGWRWAKLGEVCRVVGGSTPSSHVPEFWDGDIVWITPTDLGKMEDDHIVTSARKITKIGYENCGTELVPLGSVVLSSRAPIGHLGIAGVPLCTNQGCKSFVPSSKIDSQYLFYALKISVPKLQALGSGATFTEISKTELQRFEIPLPPLAEQKRIAEILEQQMAAVERARRSAEAQLQAAENLPVAHLRAVFSSPKAQEWQKKKLGDVFKVKSGEGLTAKAMTPGGLYPVYGGNGINGYHDSYLFEESKIVIGRVGAYCGCIHTTEPKSWITDNALYVSEKFDEFKDEFMVHALCFLDLNTKANSMAQPLVTGQLIYPLEIGIPPLDEQPRLASQLSAQMSSAERLRQTLTEQLDTINQLPAALLRRAFNGGL